jgi:hypothetical protein
MWQCTGLAVEAPLLAAAQQQVHQLLGPRGAGLWCGVGVVVGGVGVVVLVWWWVVLVWWWCSGGWWVVLVWCCWCGGDGDDDGVGEL